MKKRIPASEMMKQEIREIISGQGKGEESSLSEFIRQSAALVMQECLEAEVKEYLGRGHYERSSGGEERSGVYRNGYEKRRVRSSEGPIDVQLPQLRNTLEPYSSKLMEFFRGNTDVLEKLALEMYARGLSDRDVEDALNEATGDQLLSKSSASRISECLWEEYEAFQGRDLSGYAVEHLFLDAIYESLNRRYGVKQAVLCAWGITRSGEKILLGLSTGNHESYEDWLDFIRHMKAQGLRTPTTTTTDGSPGLIKAVEMGFSESIRIRCWFHRMENFCNKVPREAWAEVKADLCAIRDAKSYDKGKQLAQAFISQYQGEFPTLIKCFREDLEALLGHLHVPISLRRRVRTSNLIERAFEEERRRTKVIPGFMTEKAALKLIFSVLIRASKRWSRVKFSEFDLAQLDKLRKGRKMDPQQKLKMTGND